MKTRTFLKALALPFAYSASRSFAQGASRSIRMVVPLPAGSGNDFVARVISPGMTKTLGQSIIVDNKPGASGTIGAMEVVRAAPDGLTLLCATNSHLATNVALLKSMPYDPRKDLTPLGGAVSVAQVLVVKATAPYKTLPEFIAYAKANPGKVSVGFSTSIVKLQFATLSRMAGIDLLLVPYKGAPAAINDVIGGVLDATLDIPSNVVPHITAGNLRAVASMSRRSPMLPDVAAASDTLPGFDFPLWNAFAGPAHMPRELVQRLGSAIAQAQRQPEVDQQLRNAGQPPFIISPDDLKAYIETEVTKYLRLAKEAGIQPE